MSQTIGEIVFFLVLLLFLPMILNALALGGLLEPLQLMIAKILGFLPNLLAATIILVIGWFIARILQKIVTNLLIVMGSEKLSERVGLTKIMGSQGLAGLIGLVVYILILIPVLIAALQALAIDAITCPSPYACPDACYSANLFGAALVLGGFHTGKDRCRIGSQSAGGIDLTLCQRLGLASHTQRERNLQQKHHPRWSATL